MLNSGISINDINLRVVIYARVSTNHKEQKNSLVNQVEHFKKVIDNNLNWTYIATYIDDGITGTNDIKREQFMKMINDSKSDKFDLIITKEISRFSRNTLDSIKYTRELLNDGVAVFFVNDNINTIFPDAELRLTIMASLAQDEIRRLSERVRFGMNRAIEKKVILGNNLLYGYKKDKENKKLVIIEEEARVVESIYRKYVIDKLSISKIVKELNSKNIKTSMGNKFSISTVSRMIANPKYKGYYCGRKTTVINYMTKKVKYLDKSEWKVCKDIDNIPPIVSEQIWDLANERLNNRKTKYKKSTNNKRLYLYSNKIYCKMDKTIFYRRYFKRNKKDVSWVCSTYLKDGKKKCNSPNIRESELNCIFDNIIKQINIDSENIINILINNYKKINLDANNSFEIAKLEKKKQKILELFLDEMITRKELATKMNDYARKIKYLEEESSIVDFKKINTSLQEMTTLDEIRKNIIFDILDYIEVSKIGKNILLDIHLLISSNNFLNKVEFKREETNKTVYILKYHFS